MRCLTHKVDVLPLGRVLKAPSLPTLVDQVNMMYTDAEPVVSTRAGAAVGVRPPAQSSGTEFAFISLMSHLPLISD